MKIIGKFLVVVFLLILAVTAVIAYEGETHSDLNKTIAEFTDDNSKDLDSYIKNLGFDNGITTEFCSDVAGKNCRKAYLWLALGGEQEDEPGYTRSRNHFHYPLLPWDHAGLDHPHFSGQSSIIWSQDQTNSRITDLGGDWSWSTARKFYYAALTGDSTDLDGFKVYSDPFFWQFPQAIIVGQTDMNETERSPFFAWTFRALGQVMHLVQDASVPAHTRNDVHILYNYEKAVKKLIIDQDPIYLNAVNNPISFATSILDGDPNPLAPIPIAKIIDTDTYDFPVYLDVTTSDKLGLAEYSHVNFFSESTSINSASNFYPNTTAECTKKVTKDVLIDGKMRKIEYFLKDACGEDNGGEGYLLARTDVLGYWKQLLGLIGYQINMLDDEIYKDYAKLLIPRAVGYSKGLLDYFFRGTLEISPPSEYVYSVIDGSVVDESINSQTFTHIKAKIKNTTATGEEMLSGELVAVAKYKKLTNKK